MENYYTYILEMAHGLCDPICLTSLDTIPYGEHLPLYSAFKGFEALDKETMNSISADIKDKKANHHTEIVITSVEVSKLVTEDKMEAMYKRAQKSYAKASKHIEKTLHNISFEINNLVDLLK